MRTYPAQIWMLTKAANNMQEFRMSLNGEGQLGVWSELAPLYASLNRLTSVFSGIWTPYEADFLQFSANCVRDIDHYTTGALSPQSDVPANVLNISCIPWVAFTAFNLNLPTDYMLPILTIGKYVEQDERTLMPLAIQVHHAVCDGFHLGLFVEQVQELAENAREWLRS